MARPSPSREPGKSKGPNAKETRHRPKPKNAAAKKSAAKKAKKAAARKRAARRKASEAEQPRTGSGTSSRPRDPSDVPDAEVRFIQPYDAAKAYLCPGCNQTIPAGLGHMVAIPPADPDLRRHWHRGCWANRLR